MLMTFEPERLVMTVDEAERESLRAWRAEDPDRFGRDETWYEMIEDDLFHNDEFMDLPEGYTGDLTSAPMLAILGDDEYMTEGCRADPHNRGIYPTGSASAAPILWRWAFMDYAVESPQGALADTGRAVWMGGKLLDRGQPDVPAATKEVSLRKGW